MSWFIIKKSGDGIIREGSSGQPVEWDKDVDLYQRDVTGRTCASPPRSGPSLQPQSHSVHHGTGTGVSSSTSCADILESGRGNGSGGRLACGVAVRGGGERGLGRSSGAGALTAFDFFDGCGDNDEAAADSGSSWSKDEGDAPMSSVMGCALTNNDDAEPAGSENGSVVWA